MIIFHYSPIVAWAKKNSINIVEETLKVLSLFTKEKLHNAAHCSIIYADLQITVKSYLI